MNTSSPTNSSNDHQLFKDVVTLAKLTTIVVDGERKVLMIQGGDRSKLNLDTDRVEGALIDELFREHPTLLKCIEKSLGGSRLTKDIKIGEFTWSVSFSPVFYDNKQVSHTILVCTDTTEKREAELVLLGKELRFRTLFNAASDAIFMMDNKTFVDCNEATLQIFRCKREQIVGQTPYRFSPKHQPSGKTSEEAAMEKINAALAGEPQFFEWTHIHYDGTPFDAEVSLNRIDIGDQVFIQAIVRDITTRKLAEKLMQDKNEELSKINAELDRFVYSASHDLRAPIASLLGIIDLMRNESDLESIKQLTNLQEKSLNRMDEFIKDIVNYSRNMRMEIEPCQMDIESEINDIWEQLNFMENVDKVEKILKINSTAVFLTDVKRLRVVLNNLISNAIKYCDLTKSNPFVKFDININERQAQLTVLDNGIGVPKEVGAKIFDMFYRASENGSGSGLGLYIVQETIHKLQGSITMKSEIMQYTQFDIVIPNSGSPS